MPNIFGGDQFHPAYKPRELKENEVLIKNVLYTISFNTREKVIISCEDVDGSIWGGLEKTVPEEVQKKITFLRSKRQSGFI